MFSAVTTGGLYDVGWNSGAVNVSLLYRQGKRTSAYFAFCPTPFRIPRLVTFFFGSHHVRIVSHRCLQQQQASRKTRRAWSEITQAIIFVSFLRQVHWRVRRSARESPRCLARSGRGGGRLPSPGSDAPRRGGPTSESQPSAAWRTMQRRDIRRFAVPKGTHCSTVLQPASVQSGLPTFAPVILVLQPPLI